MLKKLIKTHNAARDWLWEFLTKPNPPSEKMFAWVPRTANRRSRFIHSIDDLLVAFKNRLQRIERYAFFLILLFSALLVILYILVQLATLFGFTI